MRNSAAQAGEWTSPLTLSIVVPCYNEEEVLPETLKRLEEFLERLMNPAKISRDSEIVLVDDGSHDGVGCTLAWVGSAPVLQRRRERAAGHEQARRRVAADAAAPRFTRGHLPDAPEARWQYLAVHAHRAAQRQCHRRGIGQQQRTQTTDCSGNHAVMARSHWRGCCASTSSSLWFNLSDPAVRGALYDSVAMSTFVGIDLGVDVAQNEPACKFAR